MDNNLKKTTPHLNRVCCGTEAPNTAKDYFEIGLVAVFLGLLYVIGKKLNLLPDLGVSNEMSYLMVFGLGLVAAFSTCIATTGALLLAVSERYAGKFPHFYFNLGRLASYAFFGGAIGALGSVINPSPYLNGLLVIGVSILMIFLGMKMLKILPNFGFSILPMSWAEKLYDFGKKKSGAALSGAATFFLPCGFTQALQIYVLSAGSAATGALTMFIFALGTAPSLLSLGAISSFGSGAFKNYFTKMAGVAVLIFGLTNIGNGLNLAGFNTGGALAGEVISGPGAQIVKMKVVGLDYEPAQFTVVAGRPVEWLIDGSEALGCAKIIIVPKLGLQVLLSKDKMKKVTFTPTSPGRIAFSCSMGMTTPGAAFNVVAN